jgi:tetratricopeptide (TPR) repeat protein
VAAGIVVLPAESGLLMPNTIEAAPSRRLRLPHPKTVAALLAVLLLAGGVLTAWRYVAAVDAPPMTYHEFQIQRWEEVLAEKPDDPAIWATLGSLHEKAGDDSRAQKAYSRALELDPTNPSALVYRARAMAADGKTDSARSMLTRAADGLPEGGRFLVLFQLGELERDAGRDKAAIEAYEASAEDNSTFWNAHYELAVLYEKAGKANDALRSAYLARRFSPDDPNLEELIERLKAGGAKAKVEKTGMDAGGKTGEGDDRD